MSDPTQPMQGLKLQCIAWALGLTFFAWFVLTFGVLEQLGFDAGHATSVARNLIEGKGLRTSIIASEALFNQEVIPAIQTIWPPGMPIATALLHVVSGIEPAIGFIWINAAAHLLTAVLVVVILTMAGLRFPVAMAAGFICLVTVPNWILVIRGHSEPPMVVFGLIFLLTTVLALRSPVKRGVSIWVLLAIASGAIGFLMRYQSMALIGPVIMLALFGLTGRLGTNFPVRRSVAIGLGLTIVILIFLGSNVLIAGAATGSDSPFSTRSLSEVADALVLVPDFAREVVFVTQIVLTIALALFTLAIAGRKPRVDVSGARLGQHQTQVLTLIFSSFTVVAVVGMISILTFMTPAYPWLARYFVPSLPMLIIALIVLMLLGSRRTAQAIQGSKAAGVLTTTGVVIALGAQIPAAELIQTAKGKNVLTVAQSVPVVRALLENNTTDDGVRPVLMSNHEAYLGLVTSHPVLGTPFPDPIKPGWDEYRVAKAARRYRVTHVIYFSDYPKDWGRNDLTRVLMQNPEWLEKSFANESVVIYTINPDRLSVALDQLAHQPSPQLSTDQTQLAK